MAFKSNSLRSAIIKGIKFREVQSVYNISGLMTLESVIIDKFGVIGYGNLNGIAAHSKLLRSVIIKNISLENLDLSEAFSSCESLETIELGNLRVLADIASTSKGIKVTEIFQNCSYRLEILLSDEEDSVKWMMLAQ